jgi:hypothetical protein
MLLAGCGLAWGAIACESTTSAICNDSCDCEHCNDWERERRCNEAEWSEDVASAYSCEGSWDSLASCIESNGTCNESQASYTTQQAGACSGEMGSGFQCTVTADCTNTFGANYFCANAECRTRACASVSVPCTTDDDCPGGIDLCEAERQALADCQRDASSVSPFLQLGSDVSNPPSPGPTPGPGN